MNAYTLDFSPSGLRLGWLLNPRDRQADIYRPQEPPAILIAPDCLTGELVRPGFILNLAWLWS
ncbi:Uma2 family endonuclease [Trichothermofontia sp.]